MWNAYLHGTWGAADAHLVVAQVERHERAVRPQGSRKGERGAIAQPVVHEAQLAQRARGQASLVGGLAPTGQRLSARVADGILAQQQLADASRGERGHERSNRLAINAVAVQLERPQRATPDHGRLAQRVSHADHAIATLRVVQVERLQPAACHSPAQRAKACGAERVVAQVESDQRGDR